MSIRVAKRAKCIDTDTKTNVMPLMVAAFRGSGKTVNILIDAGANVNAASKDGWTPLMVAAQSGHDELVRILLAHGADVNAPTALGWTPLMAAAFTGRSEVVRTLIDNKANINAVSVCSRGAPIVYMVTNAHGEIANFVIDSRARAGDGLKAGWTALRLAAWNGRGEVVKILLAHPCVLLT